VLLETVKLFIREQMLKIQNLKNNGAWYFMTIVFILCCEVNTLPFCSNMLEKSSKGKKTDA
jgi:hypothetical protein